MAKRPAFPRDKELRRLKRNRRREARGARYWLRRYRWNKRIHGEKHRLTKRALNFWKTHRHRREHLNDLVVNRRALLRERRKANIIARKLRHQRKGPVAGTVWFDGKVVAGWIAEDLARARRAGWRGVVVSGYRDPWYSQRLCYAMCGRPYCAGRCAGTSSNHVGRFYPQGAVDVTDYWTLASVARRLGLRIRNNLPADRVHFSASGR